MQIHFDRFAILLSGICAIHCIAFPVVASLIPLLATTIQHGHDLHEFWFHNFILIFIVPVSVIALITGFRFHRQWLPLGIAIIGLSVLTVTALFAGHLISHHIIPHEGETLLTISGGLIHAVGHALNVLATHKLHSHSFADSKKNENFNI